MWLYSAGYLYSGNVIHFILNCINVLPILNCINVLPMWQTTKLFYINVNNQPSTKHINMIAIVWLFRTVDVSVLKCCLMIKSLHSPIAWGTV